MRPIRKPPSQMGVQQALKIKEGDHVSSQAVTLKLQVASTAPDRQIKPNIKPPQKPQRFPPQKTQVSPVSDQDGERRHELRPWVHVPKGTVTQPLSPAEQHVHDLLRAWRALRLIDLLEATTPQILRAMIARHEVYLHPTLLGPCAVLGPYGRFRAGLRPDNRPSTTGIMDDAYMAHAVSLLVADHNWQFLKRQNRRYMMDMSDGHTCVVIGQSRGHTARSLRRIVGPLLFEAARNDLQVLIVTPDRRRTVAAEKRGGRIQVMHLRMLKHIQRRSLREREDLLSETEKRRASQRTG